jgi:AraC family transcriptional regulator
VAVAAAVKADAAAVAVVNAEAVAAADADAKRPTVFSSLNQSPDVDFNPYPGIFRLESQETSRPGGSASHTLVVVREKWKAIQPVVAKAAREAEDETLAGLAAALGQSPSHAHRTLSAALGETPKQYTLRLRLDRAAGLLLGSKDPILDIALTCGFQSPEVFLRAFRRRYGLTPSAYRKRGIAAGDAEAHAAMAARIAPCVGLIHLDTRLQAKEESSVNMTTYDISLKHLPAQPVVLIRKRVPRPEIGPAIGSNLPAVFRYTQAAGIGIDGHPVTRYPEYGPGMVTLETGMRVTAFTGDWNAGEGDGSVFRDELPAGPAASTVHAGPYDGLQQAYGAVEQWIAANGYEPAGAPWEVYLNDPGDHPDPKDWKTEIFWPVRQQR